MLTGVEVDPPDWCVPHHGPCDDEDDAEYPVVDEMAQVQQQQDRRREGACDVDRYERRETVEARSLIHVVGEPGHESRDRRPQLGDQPRSGDPAAPRDLGFDR